MLLRFSVENFLCFKGEATLSLAATADDRHEDHLIPAIKPGRVPALRAAAIYGANGHGKTKLVEAIQFVERLVMTGLDNQGATKQTPFKFSSEAKKKPSRFVIEFRVGKTDYEYGLVMKADQILEEWLYARYNRRNVMLYERDSASRSKDSSGVKFGSTLKLSASPNSRFDIKDYLEFIATSLETSELFLVEAAKRGITPLHEPLGWFTQSLHVVNADASYTPLHSRALEDEEFLPFLSQYVQNADTGIQDLTVRQRPITRLEIDDLGRSSGTPLGHDADLLEPGEDMMLRGEEGQMMAIRKTSEGEFLCLTLAAQHATDDGKAETLDIADESAGTRRLVDLLPMLIESSRVDRVFVVDELDRKLHPLLAYEFLRTFLKCKRTQLIFTTHNTLLLSLDLFRRDEIWFAQKKADLSVELYSLADFKVRPDLDVKKGYLNGRFGAIPFLGSLSDIGWCAPDIDPAEIAGAS
jgi:AAA15 family ATPase/GTPase